MDDNQFRVYTRNSTNTSSVERLRITGLTDTAVVAFQNSNIGIGTASPSQKLDVNGSVDIGGFIYKGSNPFVHNSGTNNTFLGLFAGNLTVTGGSNTAVGLSALSANTSGDNNTAIGEDALFANTSGDNNTAIGEDALKSTTTNGQNTAVGEGAL